MELDARNGVIRALPAESRALLPSGEDVFEAQAQEGQNHVRIEP